MKKNKKPYFSIIVPIYNVEKYLKRCIDSIINQEFQDYEIILVDDESPDNCPKICDDLSKSDERISVIHKKNEGLGMARNTGLEAAKGKYIFFIDSDDYIMPNLLNDVYKEIEKSSSEVVFYGFNRINAKGNVYYESIPKVKKNVYEGKKEIINEILPDFIAEGEEENKNLSISAWSCCLNVEFLKKNGLKFVSERKYISEDIYFYMDMFYYLSKISFLDKAYYCYCQNQGSLTYSYKPDRFERLKFFYKTMQELSQQYKYPKVVNERLYGAFISNVMACIKMEVANRNNSTRKQAFEKSKKIYRDEFLQEAVNNYNCTNKSKGWKLFYYCIKKEKYNLLSNVILINYKTKGI